MFKPLLALVLLIIGGSTLADEDSVLVMEKEGADKLWEIDKLKRPMYPRDAAINNVEGCSAVAFIIETNGKTSSHQPLVGAPSEIFIKPSLKAVKGWRFKATEANPERTPIYTYQVISFSLGHVTSENYPAELCSDAAAKAFRELAGWESEAEA